MAHDVIRQLREYLDFAAGEVQDATAPGYASPQADTPWFRRGPALAVLAALVVIAVGLPVLLLNTDDRAPQVGAAVKGTWQVTSFTLEGEQQTVQSGVNAASVPWVTIRDGEVVGDAGCNGFGGPLTFNPDASALMMDVVMEAAFCGPEDGSLMQTDFAFEAVMWSEDLSIEVTGNEMVWSNGSDSITFTSVNSPPTTVPFEPPPQTSVGRLDCSPGFVEEKTVADEGQDPLEIAQAANPNVVAIEPGEPLWFSGVNANGEVVVELALGDSPGADYQVWTCEAAAPDDTSPTFGELPIDIVDLAGVRTPVPADLAVAADWVELDPGPLGPRWAAAAFWTGEEIVIWGGETVGGSSAVSGGAAYDPASGTWRTVADGPIADQADVSWVWTGNEFVAWNQQQAAAWNPDDNTWRTIPDWPLTSTFRDTAAWTGEAVIDAVSGLVVDVSDGTSTAIADPPALHERASVVWVDGRLVSVTGEGAYNPTTDSWAPVPESALTPLAAAGAAIGDRLVAVDYEMDAAEYNPEANTWTPLPDLPLRFSECGPRIQSFQDSPLVDHCSGLAFWTPATSSWIPVPHPQPAPQNLQPAIIPADGRLFAWGDGFYEFIGNPEQPERIAIGTSVFDVPEDWTIVTVTGDAPVEAIIESADGETCTVSGYNSDAEGVLRNFLTPTTAVIQLQPAIGNERDALDVEAGTIDDQHHLVWPTGTTDAIDVRCTSETATQEIARRIWMPYQ